MVPHGALTSRFGTSSTRTCCGSSARRPSTRGSSTCSGPWSRIACFEHVTTADFFADRCPDELCMVFGLLSKAHREALKDAKRGDAMGVLRVKDVVQSVELLDEAWRVHRALGLPPMTELLTTGGYVHKGFHQVLVGEPTYSCSTFCIAAAACSLSLS